MNVAIIGSGFTGLSAAYSLLTSGHSVTVFEKESFIGGLAHGFRGTGWTWPLEAFYHHFFTNDDALLTLAHELNLDDRIIIKRPITATLLPGPYIYQLDSPKTLLRFDRLSPIDRLRTGMMLGLLKLNPLWTPLESITAEQLIKKLGGQTGWETLWEPLLYGKFHDFAPRIAASWFWGRIKKRTPNLGYFRGGFQTLADQLTQEIIKRGGKILTHTAIDTLKQEARLDSARQAGSKNHKKSHKKDSSCFIIHNSYFDAVLLTTPTPIANNLLSSLKTHNSFTRRSPAQPGEGRQLTTYNPIPHLHAQILILETKEPILDRVYWLNMNDRSFPFLAAVFHTNFIDKKYYGGHHISYFGNYLPDNHPYLSMNKKQILEIFLPYIKKIATHHNSQFTIHNSFLFTAPFAQPVHELHYSSRAPKLDTGVAGIYLANMDSIYPWDRGTNYAVELGRKAAYHMMHQQ